jgi:electron transport complex protein RnfA
MNEFFVILISAIFVNNFVLSQFLGICPFIGVSKKLSSAVGMGMAVTFVMFLASIVTWTIQKFILTPYHLEYLQTVMFILVIASLVQLVEMFIKKNSPVLYTALGVFLPLITTNCAVLGCAIINIKKDFNLMQTSVYSVGGALGFTLALVIMAGIRERLEVANVPKSMEGAPIAFVTAGLLAISFMGFAGLVKF